MFTALTAQQKLEALALRFYQGRHWKPLPGHYYTTSRADLELYRIVKIEDGKIFTEYTTSPGVLCEWAEVGFTTEGFGIHRIWVPDFILKMSSDEGTDHY